MCPLCHPSFISYRSKSLSTQGHVFRVLCGVSYGPTEITSTSINSLLNYSRVTLRNSMQPPNGAANLLESCICCIIKVNKGVTV